MTQAVSFTITSFAPVEVDQHFISIKKELGYYLHQELTNPSEVITKNHAHLTLQRSFYLNDEHDDVVLRDELEKVAVPQIEIASKRASVFKTETHGNSIVLSVDKSPSLSDFYDVLESTVGPLVGGNTVYKQQVFTPHLSVFYNVPEHDVERLLRYTEQQFLPLRYVMGSFELLKEITGRKGVRERVEKYLLREK